MSQHKEIIEKLSATEMSSRILSESLRDSLSGRKELIKLIYSEKLAVVSPEELNELRRKLSKRFITR